MSDDFDLGDSEDKNKLFSDADGDLLNSLDIGEDEDTPAQQPETKTETLLPVKQSEPESESSSSEEEDEYASDGKRRITTQQSR